MSRTGLISPTFDLQAAHFSLAGAMLDLGLLSQFWHSFSFTVRKALVKQLTQTRGLHLTPVGVIGGLLGSYLLFLGGLDEYES